MGDRAWVGGCKELYCGGDRRRNSLFWGQAFYEQIKLLTACHWVAS